MVPYRLEQGLKPLRGKALSRQPQHFQRTVSPQRIRQFVQVRIKNCGIKEVQLLERGIGRQCPRKRAAPALGIGIR